MAAKRSILAFMLIAILINIFLTTALADDDIIRPPWEDSDSSGSDVVVAPDTHPDSQGFFDWLIDLVLLILN